MQEQEQLSQEEPNQGGGAWATGDTSAVPTEGSIAAGDAASDAGMSQAAARNDGPTNADPGPVPQLENGQLQPQYATETIAEGERYTVSDGDSLQTIAARFYGSALEWERIYQANTDRLSNPDHLYPGQELVIPAAGGTPTA